MSEQVIDCTPVQKVQELFIRCLQICQFGSCGLREKKKKEPVQQDFNC